MNKTKQNQLKAAGWRVGSTREFLGLSDEEAAFVEVKLALAHSVRQQRQAHNLTQNDLAQRMGTSQSRIAKVEAASGSVSIDLIVRCLLALGVTRRDLSHIIGAESAKHAA